MPIVHQVVCCHLLTSHNTVFQEAMPSASMVHHSTNNCMVHQTCSPTASWVYPQRTTDPVETGTSGALPGLPVVGKKANPRVRHPGRTQRCLLLQEVHRHRSWGQAHCVGVHSCFIPPRSPQSVPHPDWLRLRFPFLHNWLIQRTGRS